MRCVCVCVLCVCVLCVCFVCFVCALRVLCLCVVCALCALRARRCRWCARHALPNVSTSLMMFRAALHMFGLCCLNLAVLFVVGC